VITTLFLIVIDLVSIIVISFFFIIISDIFIVFIIIVIWLKSTFSNMSALFIVTIFDWGLAFSTKACPCLSHLIEQLIFLLFIGSVIIFIIKDFLIFSSSLVVLKVFYDLSIFLSSLFLL
jgi:hypothetical protein